jgi:hypothetical protein
MRPKLRFACLLGVVAVVLPVLAQDPAATPEGPDPKLIEKALAQPFLQGRLVAVDVERKSFVIEAVIDSKKTLNKEGQAAYARLYAKALQAYRSRNKDAYDRLLPELNAAALGVYDVKDTTHQFKLQGRGEFQVRIDKLPPREGEDGKIKAYTPAELAKLKGPNASLPGYVYDAKQLESDAVVRAYLVRQSKAKTPPKEEKPKLVIKTAGSADKPKEMMEEENAHPISLLLVVPPADLMPQLPGAPAPPGANPFVIK